MAFGFWCLVAAAAAFAITAVSGKWMIPFLHKLKFGQTIREVGPKWHQKKQGTPTMGGIMFILGITVASLVCIPLYFATGGTQETHLQAVRVYGGLLMALGFGLIGFMDDYISVVKKRNMGLNERQKMIMQFLVAGAYLLSLYVAGDTSAMVIPFVGTVDWGIAYWIIALLAIVGMNNAVNFTDGIDGLNSTVTFFFCLFMMLCAGALSLSGLSILAAAAAGGCLGFLVWNFNPAKVFMGDTGSLFLGGLVCALAFGMDMPILLLPAGIIYLCELGSVVLQVTYFKLTHGKRIFKMAPIHHHFEMSGWNEVKICGVFGFITLIGSAAALACVLFGV